MLGSNYIGQFYYGQGPAVGSGFTTKTVSATAIALATVSTQVLINASVAATAVAVATVQRQVNRTVSAVAIALATISSVFVEALNIRNAWTKFLTTTKTTRGISGFSYSSKDLTTKKTTRVILDEE